MKRGKLGGIFICIDFLWSESLSDTYDWCW